MVSIFAFFVIVSVLACVHGASINDRFFEPNEMPLNEHQRLTSHWILLNDNANCRISVLELFLGRVMVQRQFAAVEGSFARQLFGENFDQSACLLANIHIGTHVDHIVFPIPEDTINLSTNRDHFDDWITDVGRAEVGMVSFHANESDIYWISPNDHARHLVGHLKYGERHTSWQQSYIGHKFEIVDSKTGELLRAVEIQHNSHFVIGDSGSRVRVRDVDSQVQNTFQGEWQRAHQVKRTFTELGFSIGRLPSDLFASMSTYYYNNRKEQFREEWEAKGGVHVNWWEVDAHMVGMPWELKRYWQARLKDLVEEWIGGVPLELTDIYGMRRYNDGARLLTHVDREETHATSLIVNIAQSGIRKPWFIEIYDFDDRLHEIEMHEGDIVYYESARCLHGRMKPLEGDYYVNLFAHYRPTGDPKWFKKSNPEDATSPLLDIGECAVQAKSGKVQCSKADLPHISPELEKLHGPEDLFSYWKKTGEIPRYKAPISPATSRSGPSQLLHSQAAHAEL